MEVYKTRNSLEMMNRSWPGFAASLCTSFRKYKVNVQDREGNASSESTHFRRQMLDKSWEEESSKSY